MNLDDVPHITILRPVKGLEPQLYECLAATFHQTYPSQKLAIYFCVASSSDPAYPVLLQLLSDFPAFDTKILIEEEDPNLSGDGERATLGPNPKIRNMSRGYREAKGDIVWVIDCNVWVGEGVAGRMVDKLCGYTHSGALATPYKFVHQLPLVVDGVEASASEETRGLLQDQDPSAHVSAISTSAYSVASPPAHGSGFSEMLRTSGGRLEEMFMATSHAKFYTAINTLSVAPCVVGKSNMFRRSHLDALTTTSSNKYSPGIDFFSENICEDHLIGDLLWRSRIPASVSGGQKFKNHGLVFGDLAIQPMADMSVREYMARRVRWLRVRKWTVTLATSIEPGIEPLLCSAYGAFALSTLPYFAIPHTWATFLLVWLLIVLMWMSVDTFAYAKLHSGSTLGLDADTPSFARPPPAGNRRGAAEWIAAWFGREVLALPIWTWACYGGTTVAWRGKTFRVGLDMKVKEIRKKGEETTTGSPVEEMTRA